ncbi:hypothetical protein OKA05_15315 [Luteolibacter arcticus]|uniref:Uncharacterized protein n=1 Tax=Luteolibacter arcticus TaxID=1581411 RepID=A0ABT3GK81_9BACT|nr:hypothetical protein [Luteolibacter arcticus]MCW1923935.1 hypothetical protein [Luteolibacter arcticus]
MNPRFAILTTLALFAAAPTVIAEPAIPTAPKEAPKETPAPPVKPEEYAKTLLGSWRSDMKEGPVTGHSITTYLEDGKATSTGNFEAGGQKISVTAKAKWTLEKDKLITEITDSSMPEMMPVGTKIEQTILSLSDKEFRYTQSGKELTEKRVKDEKPKAVPAK